MVMNNVAAAAYLNGIISGVSLNDGASWRASIAAAYGSRKLRHL